MDDPFNSSYTYVDDVVVAPFDVVPDTIVLCEGDEIEFNITFFDRWGNQLLNVPNVRKSDTVSWDGYFRGALMDPAVFVWTFQYTSEKDGKTRIISGDAALVY
jgi:hypothetical protein